MGRTNFVCLLLAPVLLGVSTPAWAQARQWTTRTQLAVLSVEAPNAEWAVVQLHVRSSGEGVPASEAAALEQLTHSLAMGQSRRGASAQSLVQAAGGQTQVFRTLDTLVISDALPASELDVALRAMDLRLRSRRRLEPAVTPRPQLSDAQGPPPAVVRQLMAPGHPYALPDDGGADAAAVAQLADRLLRRGNVRIVVISPLTRAALTQRVNRWLRAPLPSGALVAPPVSTLVGTRVALAKPAPGDRATVWLPLPAEAGPDRIRRHAALQIIAHLLGAETGSAKVLDWMMFRVREREGPQAEKQRLAELERLTRPLAPEVLSEARVAVRTRRARPLASPERLGFAHGTGVMWGLPLDEVDAALIALSEEDIVVTARALVAGGRIVLRAPEKGSSP